MLFRACAIIIILPTGGTKAKWHLRANENNARPLSFEQARILAMPPPGCMA
jgi:hypothetical protein